MGDIGRVTRVRRAFAGVVVVVMAGLGLTSAAWADISGPVSGDAVQNGDNSFDGGQGAEIEGGDASAGSNIVGSAQQGDASITVENHSVDAQARSGDLESSNNMSGIHVGELSEDPPADDPPVEESSPVLTVEPIGPLGPIGPGDGPSAAWWGTEDATQSASANAASGDPVDPAADPAAELASDPASDPASGPSVGAAEPMGMVLAAEVGPAANDRQVLGQLTGPPGPVGPPDLEGAPEVTPSGSIVVPSPAPATPEPTQAPRAQEEQADGLPVNGANVLRLASFGLALLLLGLVLSASARLARAPA